MLDTLGELFVHHGLPEQHEEREKRLETMTAMNVNDDLRYKVVNEMYGLENKFYSLEGEVERKPASLNCDIESAKRKLAEVMKFCGTLPARNEPVAFCEESPRQTSECGRLIAEMSAVFERWDFSVP